MDLNDKILTHIKEVIGLSADDTSFDTDILTHINGSVGELNQNGVGNAIVVDEDTTWRDLENPEQGDANDYFKMVPLFIALNTKILFDPPPPSSVEVHSAQIAKLLWRLKIAYETS